MCGLEVMQSVYKPNMALDQISMFDFHFGSKSKLHRISMNSKFRFSLEFVIIKVENIKTQSRSRSWRNVKQQF